jgi:hypothetical protein
MTRKEIISQLEAEIRLLQRAGEILAAPLAAFKDVSTRKLKTKLPRKNRKQPAIVAVPSANREQGAMIAAPLAAQSNPEPQVHRVPPKRRMERRQLASDKAGKSAALSGLVPAGPVAVSADEARKVQERSVAAPPIPVATEIHAELGSERSLGSLIQAFERRAGLGALETPRS